MYRDIFSFNLNNIRSNLIILLLISILIQKSVRSKIGIMIIINISIRVVMIYRLLIAAIPNSLIIQGGVNIWFILLTGIIFRFLRNWSAFKYYKIIPTSPIIIIPIIIIIEFIRYMIRPLSLMLRILINLSIGHIVIHILWFPLSILYNLVEIFVYTIQIYIFWTLVSIYSK